MTKPVETIFGGEGGVAVDEGPGGTRQGLVAEDPNGTYLLLGVDDYDGSGASSYLRIGAAAAGAGALGPPSATGEDLAALVQGFTDDSRNRGGALDGGSAPTETVMSGLTESAPIGPSGRVDESGAPLPSSDPSFQHLHRKGGWRDHTDGNRITTTRGDKIEVIRGNYKLLVLGRQQTAGIETDTDARRALIGNSAGVEMSGGLVDTDPNDLAYPDNGGRALDVGYAMEQRSDGTWGWVQTTIVGEENPQGPPTNYRIINQTWVDYQDTQLGSPSTQVPNISQETYAKSMSSLADADVNESITASGELFTTTDAAALHDVTRATISTEIRVIGASAEADVSALIAVVELILGIRFDLMIGAVCDVKIGPHVDNHIGVHMDTHAGMHLEDTIGEHADTHLGTHTDVHVGVHQDIHLGPHVSFDGLALDISGDEISLRGIVMDNVTVSKLETSQTEYRSVLTAALHTASDYHIKM